MKIIKIKLFVNNVACFTAYLANAFNYNNMYSKITNNIT